MSPEFTERQVEIMRLLAQGLTREQCARRLFLSVETVKTHLKAAMRRSQTRSQAHLIAVGFREGVLA